MFFCELLSLNVVVRKQGCVFFFFPAHYSSTNATFVQLSPNNSVPQSQIFQIFLEVFCIQTRRPACFSSSPRRSDIFLGIPALILTSSYFQSAGQLLSFMPFGDHFLIHCSYEHYILNRSAQAFACYCIGETCIHIN